MADRRRRKPTAQAARIALIVALDAAAALALWRIWPAAAPEVEASTATAVPPVAERRTVARPAALERARQSRLERELQRIVDDAVEQARVASKNKVRSDNTAVAIHVRQLGAGPQGELALGSDRLMRPASNLKLITTAAALALLGSEWNFETRFEASGAIVDGVLEGDLVVRAAADPLYDPTSAGDVEHLLAPALDELRARGLRAIRGNVVLDEGHFLAPAPGPEWPDASQHWAEYCALAGGFSANRGCLDAVVTPTRVGEHARVEVFPRDHGLPESIGVRTESKGGTNVQIGAKPSGVLVKGTIGAKSDPYVGSFAHPDPVELFGRTLCGALSRKGILLQGRLLRTRGAPGGELLATLRTPLARYLAPINSDSNNAVADQVFLATANAISGAGTREAGGRATELALERLGVPTEGFAQVDGSGLSRANRVTAHQIVALIEAVLLQNEASARMYLDSLAVAGERGTLSDRMNSAPARGRVRAKTGFIGGTSALSGVAYALDGRQFVFSILVNYPNFDGLNPTVWKPMQDQICTRLVEAAP